MVNMSNKPQQEVQQISVEEWERKERSMMRVDAGAPANVLKALPHAMRALAVLEEFFETAGPIVGVEQKETIRAIDRLAADCKVAGHRAVDFI